MGNNSDGGDVVSLGFDMHGPTHRLMKMQAVSEGCTIPEVYQLACEEYLEKRGFKIE